MGSTFSTDGASVRGVGGVPDVGVDVDNGDAEGIGNTGAGSLGVGGVGDMGMGGLVLAWVTFGLPWTQEVTCSKALGAVFRGNSHTSSSRDSGHVLVKHGERRSCWRVGRG